MPEYTTSAIILDLRDYGEADRIVTAYTKDFGKITGIAKSAKKSRRRFGAAMDLFAHVVLTFFSKETSGMVRLDSCRLLQSFPHIHEDITGMSYGSYLTELAKEMSPEGDPHLEVFNTLVALLSLIDTAGPREDFLRIFEMRILTAAGYHPSLHTCSRCNKQWGKGETFWFSFSLGGVVCTGCKTGQKLIQPLSLGTARLLEQACTLTPDKIQRLIFSAQAREESGRILPLFIRYHLGKELNSYRFLKKMGGGCKTGEREAGGVKGEA